MNKPTLREQLAAKCVHFTGIQNATCKAGVAYESVKDASSGPYKWPCTGDPFKTGRICTTTCAQRQPFTPEEIEADVAEWEALLSKVNSRSPDHPAASR